MKTNFYFALVAFLLIESSFSVFAQKKGDVVGKFYSKDLICKQDSQLQISIGEKLIFIDGTTILESNFGTDKKKTRVRIFYKEESDKLYATKIISEHLFTPNWRFIKPITGYIPATALSKNSNEDKNLKDITSWAYGVRIETRVYKAFHLEFDVTSYSFKQILAEEGSTNVLSYIDNKPKNLPLGVRFMTKNTELRLSGKFTFFRDKVIQPWIGLGYGLNVYFLGYYYYDVNDGFYENIKQMSWQPSYQFGFDIHKMSTISVFGEIQAPKASYSMNIPEFGGNYSSSEGMIMPYFRLGIVLGQF